MAVAEEKWRMLKEIKSKVIIFSIGIILYLILKSTVNIVRQITFRRPFYRKKDGTEQVSRSWTEIVEEKPNSN